MSRGYQARYYFSLAALASREPPRKLPLGALLPPTKPLGGDFFGSGGDGGGSGGILRVMSPSLWARSGAARATITSST